MDLLNWFTDLAEMLRLTAQAVARDPAVASVQHSVEFKRYTSGPIVEGYVDAELKIGLAVCWWIEVWWSSDPIKGEAEISVTDHQGQYSVVLWREQDRDWDSFLERMTEHRAAILAIEIDEVLRRSAIKQGH